MKTIAHKPKKETRQSLSAEVRSLLILRGTSLRAWARKNKLNETTVQKAIAGERTGPTAIKIRALITKELGL